MDIVYFSRTGNVKKFVSKINVENVIDGKNYVDSGNNVVLITYNSGIGEVPKEVEEFSNKYKERIKGVASSGNKNWGSYYGRSGEIIAEKCNARLMKFEMSGTKQDVKNFEQFVKSLKEDQA